MRPTATILSAFLAGHPVILSATDGRRNGADRWRFAALKLAGSTVLVSAAGRDSWQPLSRFLAETDCASDRVSAMAPGADKAAATVKLRGKATTAEIAREAYDALTAEYLGEADSYLWPEGWEWLTGRTCDHCPDMLVHPVSVKRGSGPVCSGYYAKLERQRAERKATTEGFMARAAAARGVGVLPIPPASPATEAAVDALHNRCRGTCDLDTHCPDCDGPR